eukprot:TRINITY_DN2198_c0_g2_i1.p1 TRINITY_DN2198_c0_g2~~TRINITY_DN2198_c0_g2_i1.p1  ORF type:complete len:174 (+),score=33.63 TRINITY_DN2198_c0_g2_i1:183-704(+)
MVKTTSCDTTKNSLAHLCTVLGAVNREVVIFSKEVYRACLADVVTAAKQRLGVGDKFWARLISKMGLTRKVVVRKRRRNARHLTSLENELEALKLEIADIKGHLVPQSSSGCKTDENPVAMPQQPALVRRPPPPPVKRNVTRPSSVPQPQHQRQLPKRALQTFTSEIAEDEYD